MAVSCVMAARSHIEVRDKRRRRRCSASEDVGQTTSRFFGRRRAPSRLTSLLGAAAGECKLQRSVRARARAKVREGKMALVAATADGARCSPLIAPS